ncbi:MAG: dihydrodipicolinate synthase family protein [Tissierellia bacterium]|nr:dihydrodipicolinate synthase family protein [Tissierellia bacterium]
MSFFKIKGAIPPMITPFSKEGSVDYEAHIHNMKLWNQEDLAGYLVLGSNSEAAYLNEDEKLELIRTTAKYAAKGRIIMVGTGLESTRETIKLTNKAAQAGAHCALLLTPSYYGDQMGDQAQLQYFTDVADESEIPILIYNVTKYTHINISPRVVGELSRHKNIIGMKDSSGNIPQLIQFKKVVDHSQFNLMVGTASAWYPALDLGVQAGVMALANCAPRECVEIQKLYDKGQRNDARELYERVFPVNHALTASYGVAGLKYACDLLGFKGGYVRKPLLELSSDNKEAIRKIIVEADLLG